MAIFFRLMPLYMFQARKILHELILEKHNMRYVRGMHACRSPSLYSVTDSTQDKPL